MLTRCSPITAARVNESSFPVSRSRTSAAPIAPFHQDGQHAERGPAADAMPTREGQEAHTAQATTARVTRPLDTRWPNSMTSPAPVPGAGPARCRPASGLRACPAGGRRTLPTPHGEEEGDEVSTSPARPFTMTGERLSAGSVAAMLSGARSRGRAADGLRGPDRQPGGTATALGWARRHTVVIRRPADGRRPGPGASTGPSCCTSPSQAASPTNGSARPGRSGAAHPRRDPARGELSGNPPASGGIGYSVEVWVTHRPPPFESSWPASMRSPRSRARSDGGRPCTCPVPGCTDRSRSAPHEPRPAPRTGGGRPALDPG